MSQFTDENEVLTYVLIIGLQNEEQSRSLAAKQQTILEELDRQLGVRLKEEEEWLNARLEAEKLQDIEVATVNIHVLW
jgi:hypothetical protein